MKPLAITIANLRSYTRLERFPFSDAPLVAILGNTGAGKSSILDAIVFALYGETVDKSVNLTDLISPGATQMSVTFEFSIEGVPYTVHRTKHRKQVGVTRITCPDGAVVTSVKEVNEKVQQLLGISHRTFLKTVFLPQGRFADFLTASSKDRNEIMNDLFNLEALDEVGSAVDAEHNRAETKKAVLADRRRQLPEAPDTIVAQIEQTIAQRSADVAHLDELAVQLETATAEATALLSQQRELDTLIGGLREAPGARNRLANLSALHVEKLQEIEAAAVELSKAAEMLDQAQSELRELKTTKSDAASLRSVDGLLEALGYQLIEAEGDSRTREGIAKRVAAAKRIHEVCSKAFDAAQASLNPLRTAEDKTKIALDSLDAKITEVRALEERWLQVQLEFATELERSSEREVAAKLAEETRQTALEVLTSAQVSTKQAQEALEAAKRADLAATLSEHVQPGEACPVCERPVPSSFTPRHSQGASQTAKAEKAAQAELTLAQAAHQKADRELSSAATSVREQLERVADVTQKRDGLMKQVERLCEGREITEFRPALEQRRSESAKALEATQAEVNRAKVILDGAAQERTVANTTLEGCEAELTRADEARKQRNDDITKRAAALPTKYRSGTIEKVAEARARLQAAMQAAQRVQDTVDAAAGAKAAAETAHARLETTYAQQVGIPFQAVAATLGRLAKLLDIALPLEDATPASLGLELILDAAEEREHSATTRRSKIAIAVVAAQGKCVAIRTAAGGEPRELSIQRQEEIRGLRRDLGHAHQQVEHVKQIGAKLDALEPISGALGTLKWACRANRFREYVAQQRSAQLLKLASDYLFDMTHEYGFTPNFDIDVRANHTTRPAASLSGGEKFLASLALSLAVVEQAAIVGAKIDSLFLDEGFAALDAECLEESMQELTRRARRGRSIWMITHIKDAAAYAQHSYFVEKGPDGSKIRDYDPSDFTPEAAGLVAVLTP